jgi:predicted dehydrogenase
MIPTLRVGLVGTGFLARTRARCWRRVHGVSVELAAVASRTPEAAAAFATEWGAASAHHELDALLAAGVDLVDLCVPNHLHRPMTEAAAAAGISVLCTKPMAAYVGQDQEGQPSAADVAAVDRAQMLRVALEDAEAMVGATERAGVALHYGENWVHAPGLRRVAELSAQAEGSILELRGWESHSGSHSEYARDWRHTGGGALLRLGAHPIGAMLWLKRREGVRAVAVTAEVADLGKGGGVESWGCAILAFEDGARGVAYGSDAMLGGMQSKLQVLADDHHLECNLSPHDLVRAYAPADGTFGDAYIMEKLEGQAGWSTPLPDEDWSSGQQGLCQAVAEAVVEGRPSEADGALGLEVTRAVYAAYLSAERGERVAL